MDYRSIIPTNCHLYPPQRVLYHQQPEDKFFLYDDHQTEDATTSPGDALFSINSARILGNTRANARSSYVSPLLNNVEIDARALRDAQQKLGNFFDMLIVGGHVTQVAQDRRVFINGYDTKRALDDLKLNGMSKFRELLLHCAVFDFCVKFQGISLVDVIHNEETKNMAGELQISACQHGAMSVWNSGDQQITAMQDVYLWLPPEGNPRDTAFKKPRFHNKAWSETRKAAVYISDDNLMDKIIDAFAEYLQNVGTANIAGMPRPVVAPAAGGPLGVGAAVAFVPAAGPVGAVVDPLANAVDLLGKNTTARYRLKLAMSYALRTHFRSSYVGKCLSAYGEQQYYFNLLRLL